MAREQSVPRGPARGGRGGHGDEPPCAPDSRHEWAVWRRDEHGNSFEVSRGHTEREARRIADEFEARGHKQSYWAAPSLPARHRAHHEEGLGPDRDRIG